MSMNKTDFLAAKLMSMISHEGQQWLHGRLPTVRALASRLDTSQVTAIKVLRILRDRNQVEIIEGKDGYFIPGSATRFHDQNMAATESRSRLHEISDVLRDEIVSGLYALGEPIPSLKEIRTRFGCGHSIAREAIGELIRNGLVSCKGRLFVHRVPDKSGFVRKSICFSGAPILFSSYQAKVFSFISALERDIERLGWGQLEFFLTQNPLMENRICDQKNISANIFFAFTLKIAEWSSYFESQPDIPLIVIDPSEKIAGNFRKHRNFFGIVSDNRDAGRDLGSFLARLGHRHIALFSHVELQEQRWASERKEGLSEIYPEIKTAGQHATIYCGDDDSDPTHKSNQTIRTSIVHSFNLFTKEAEIPREMVTEGFASVYNLASSHLVALRMRKAFVAALADPTITAWVCINDELAVMAQAFLLKSGISVPRDISVTGFDNSALACKLGITTYEFCFDKMGHIAIQCLLNPSSIRSRQREKIPVTGQLILRRSTGPARKTV